MLNFSDLITVIYEVNGYFLIASFKEPSKKTKQKKSSNDSNDLTRLIKYDIDDLNTGELESVYATYDLSVFIPDKAPTYFRKCVQADYFDLIKLKKKNDGNEYYYSSFLYIDENYDPFLRLISDFCLNEMKLCRLDTDERQIRDRTIYDGWDPSSTINSTILYTHSSDINFLGSGIMLKVYDMKTIIPAGLFSSSYKDYLEKSGKALGEIEPSGQIPKIIFDRCSKVSNLIEISYSRRWLYPMMGYKIMTGLAYKFPGKAFMISPDNNILEIKANPYLTEEEKIGYLYEFSTDYLKDDQLNAVAHELHYQIGSIWNLLNENSRIFLANGYFLYQQAVRGS